jgi:hypothetical protein
MSASSFYAFDIKGTNKAYLRPISDWDYLAKIVDKTMGNITTTFGGNSVISGLAVSIVSGLQISVALGKAVAQGIYMESTGATTYNLPDANGTYKIYITINSILNATFTIGSTLASVPSNGVYLADITVSGAPGGTVGTLVDKRGFIPTVANHNHTGGAQGPQLTNASIDAAAAIAYSKLNLVGNIVNTDINASAAIAYSKLNLTGNIVNGDINASAAIAYSKLNLVGNIVNTDINSSAAIAYSKLNLAGSILNADINASAAIVYSKLDLTGGIVNADVNASAAIVYSKLNLTGSIIYGDLAVGTAKVNIYDASNTLLDDSVKSIRFSTGLSVSVASNKATITATGVPGSAEPATTNSAANITLTTQRVLLGDSTLGGFTVTLPASVIDGQRIVIKNIGTANNVTVARNGSQLIDGVSTSITLTTGQRCLLVTDGTDWYRID